MTDDRWIEIARFSDLLEAQLLRGLLASHDIDAHIPEEATASAFGYGGLILDGIRVMAPVAQAGPARMLLRSIQNR